MPDILTARVLNRPLNSKEARVFVDRMGGPKIKRPKTAFENVPRDIVVQHPGDCIFVPHAYLHQVQKEEAVAKDKVSVAVSIMWNHEETIYMKYFEESTTMISIDSLYFMSVA